MVPERYLARLCWNSKNWTRPTGDAARIEQAETYNAKMGFGHEEWLFNFQWVLDGWKYGFLQPVNRSLAKVEGKVLDVRLYAISPTGSWFYVGHLRRCEVLTEDQAQTARAEFKRRGWFKDMLSHVRHVGGDIGGLQYEDPRLVFNVRFRPVDAELYDPALLVGPKDAIRKLRRYTLTSVRNEILKVESEWATRVAATQLRPTGKRRRTVAASTEMDLVQNQLQNELYAVLVKKYGADAVVMEEGFVDIKIQGDAGRTLIEVKSDSRPRFAIREALGQLLEYSFVAEKQGEHVKALIVAAPGELRPRDAEYLDHLRKRWALPLAYVCFRRGTTHVPL